MILSPPFLPPRGHLSDDASIDAAMSGWKPGSGAFPVSHRLEWHGGVHLSSPLGDGGVALPVRAIADGTVVFARPPTEAGSPDHPLRYGGGLTSNGVVVIRHDTEIGATAQGGQATQVRFYSVYMHLYAVRPAVIPGRPIYRKDEIGQAGHLYGEPNRLHFEICCDDANLAKLVGRASGNIDVTADGRTDVMFGEMYFHLPVGTLFYGARPLPQFAHAMTQPATPPARHGHPPAPAPVPQVMQAAYTSGAGCVIGLRHAGGEGAIGQRGDAVLTTYRLDGATEGTALRDADAEYMLYNAAKAISEAYPAAARPTISALFELLRFGRVIGPDALAPADVPHWREASYPGGRGWVNLNAAAVRKFSDADFPHWQRWVLIADDTNGDSRCDSAALKRIIHSEGATDSHPGFQQGIAQLDSAAVQKKLARTLCKFPSEWDASTIDQRWRWLQTASDDNPDPLTGDDYAQLKAHAQALCFPLPELFAAQWCFEPREFVRQFRRCKWLSASEFKQLMPVEVLRKTKAGMVWEPTPRESVTGSIATTQRVPLNRMMRKHLISGSVERMASFLGNAFQETQWLTKLYEDNAATRYAPWDGRGFLQLTWPSNYLGYWGYRGRDGLILESTRVALLLAQRRADDSGVNTALRSADVSLPGALVAWRGDCAGVDGRRPETLVSPAESAGYYWSSLRMAKFADEPHELERISSGATSVPPRPCYRSPSFWKASACVNLPRAVNSLYSASLNGFEARCVPYAQALAVLGEQRFAAGSGGTLMFPEALARRKI